LVSLWLIVLRIVEVLVGGLLVRIRVILLIRRRILLLVRGIDGVLLFGVMFRFRRRESLGIRLVASCRLRIGGHHPLLHEGRRVGVVVFVVIEATSVPQTMNERSKEDERQANAKENPKQGRVGEQPYPSERHKQPSTKMDAVMRVSVIASHLYPFFCSQRGGGQRSQRAASSFKNSQNKKPIPKCGHSHHTFHTQMSRMHT